MSAPGMSVGPSPSPALRRRWLPQSLVSRVFGLYAITLLVFCGTGLGLFLYHQLDVVLEESHVRAETLAAVMLPAIADSAVIGDDDTIQRTLERAIYRTSFAQASFNDLRGRTLQARPAQRMEHLPPAWLIAFMRDRLYDVNRPVVVGGRDYGVLRLSFAPELVAADLWHVASAAVVLTVFSIAGGLLLIRIPLVHWLGQLERLRSLEEDIDRVIDRPGQDPRRDTTVPAGGAQGDNAPIELRSTFDTLNRAAQTVRVQRRQVDVMLTALRTLLEDLSPAAGLATAGPVPGGEAPAPGVPEDIEAISQLIVGVVAKLRERSEQLNAIFTLSPDGFVSFDSQRRANFVSPAFTRLTGLSEAHVVGHDEATVCRLMGNLCAPGHGLRNFDWLRSGTVRRIETLRPVPRVLDVGLHLGGGDAISQVMHLRDVTHETEVDRLKSDFLATAAHELRTPMSSIYGFTELLLMRELGDDRRRDLLETVHRQTNLMISIVNELLDLARIEARRGKDFELQTIELCELVQAAVHDFQPPQGRARPEVSLPLHFPAQVFMDRGKLLQAVGNVLSNAYKYSPDGGPVHLRLWRGEAPGRPGEAAFALTIIDRGIGMTPAQLARVSERFYRADASGNIPGTGLGMSIVKEIIEIQGGQVELASQPGEGTRVTLWLPAALLPEQATAGGQRAVGPPMALPDSPLQARSPQPHFPALELQAMPP